MSSVVYSLGMLNSVFEELACFISFRFVSVSIPAFITCLLLQIPDDGVMCKTKLETVAWKNIDKIGIIFPKFYMPIAHSI